MTSSTARSLAVRRRYRDAGLCYYCGETPQPGMLRCGGCADYIRRKRAESSALMKRRVLEHYGTQCCRCGHHNQDHLTIDHVEGGGNQQRKSVGVSSGAGFYGWLVRSGYPPGFRTLCFNCNIRHWRSGRVVTELLAAILSAYGDICQLCGERDPDVLCVDHPNGGGGKHRRELGVNGGTPFYRQLRKQGYPAGYRVLCYNCNSGREVTAARLARPDAIYPSGAGVTSTRSHVQPTLGENSDG